MIEAWLADNAIDRSKLPRHVAIIMDGNGRWANDQGLPRVFGHQEGAKRVREIVETAGQVGIEVLTLYAFSHENWSRPDDEVEALFQLLTEYLQNEIEYLDENNVRLSSIGDRFRLPRECLRLLEAGERRTRNNTGLRLVLALSYGGRTDLVRCCKNIARQVASGELSWQDIDENTLTKNLATWDLPPPDLLVRTSGEERISNFLLWELAYAELVFYKANWPEFMKSHFLDALRQYTKRRRRYGQLERDVLPLNQARGGEKQC